MRVLTAAILGLFTSTLQAQGVCLRPSGAPMAQCIGGSTTVRQLAMCGEVIEIYNREVDEWLQCRLEALDNEHRERRATVLETAATMKNGAANLLKILGRMR